MVNIPDQEVHSVIQGLKFHHRYYTGPNGDTCNYCGDNLDGSPSECSVGYMIRVLEKKYKEMKAAS